MTVRVGEQISLFDLDTWCGKTSPEHSVQTTERTSERSLKKPQRSQTKMPLYLNLRRVNGHHQAASWEMGGALLGEYTMHSFGEYPKEERESRLSQILEEKPHPKYSLSAKGCQGILRRVEKRGKELPSILQKVLERQAGLSVSKNAPENPGGGKGILIQNEHTGALSTLNNQRVLCGAFKPKQGAKAHGIGYEDEKAPTMLSDQMPAVVYGICSYDSNAMKSDNPNSGIYEAETARTLDLNGGSYGGGSESFVIQSEPCVQEISKE